MIASKWYDWPGVDSEEDAETGDEAESVPVAVRVLIVVDEVDDLRDGGVTGEDLEAVNWLETEYSRLKAMFSCRWKLEDPKVEVTHKST